VLAGLLWFAATSLLPAVQVTYQVNLGVQIALGNFRPGMDTVFVSGTFSSPNWISTSAASAYALSPTITNTNIYSIAINVLNSPGTFEEHKFVIASNSTYSSSTLIWENVTGGGNRFFQVASTNMTLPAVYFTDQSIEQPSFPFIAGADFSLLPFFTDRGIVYKDHGQVQDGLAILKNHGITCVRLRLFTGTAPITTNAYNYTNDLAYTLPLAVRVKNAGMQFLLDFHYSDSWADPGKQWVPYAWSNLTLVPLIQQMHDYNSNTIAAFKAAGAMPDFVQIGNEITPGCVWPLGNNNTSAGWTNFGKLLNAAVQGITDAAGAQMPKIIVHIDRGGDWGGTQWFFDNLLSQNVPFDIIGESYYPWWHGPLSNLANCLTNAAKRYDKPIVVAETAFPWTNTFYTTNIYGIAPSPTGQVQFLTALAQIVKNVPLRLGAGVFYWGSEYQAVSGVGEAGFNTASFFDAHGNFLPGGDAVGQMAAPLNVAATLNASVLNLSWPLSGAGSSLITGTSLTSPASWTLVTNTVQNTGTVFNLTLPVQAGTTRFYRLRSN
jgi:arabinogalactan endo-1,4-beta-galactosidase